mmetsp:Transcript_10435/g.15257  ORF Transcript_10435/g.15257 Transcript_10435/m.15257 type:complete len:680 (+) Transcript_10435:84-2123(+)|eukprot:CAMPEP_0117426508 /NCGR_PEP_ID=MMETSP0758-20121206/6597_1 /TAXON_ID=63605 /ORGANISM="Percolomonas cosmopolitus, Strain AE-1 (ATCC 50343)" /LENGTH=679 /DNA_ID=CAMNT_0005211697 /DNA_START=39 /DNA_END=2078 /DNA_ORIENTATION=-
MKQDINVYLKEAGLESYEWAFSKMGITEDNIIKMTFSEFGESIGMKSIQEKRRLFKMIQQIKHDKGLGNYQQRYTKGSRYEDANKENRPQPSTTHNKPSPVKKRIPKKPAEEHVSRHLRQRSSDLAEKRVSAPMPAMQTPVESAQDNAYDSSGSSTDSSNPETVSGRKKKKTSSKTKICVAVRKRPLNDKEKKASEADIMDVLSNDTLMVREPKIKVDLSKYTEKHSYTFDEVFDEFCTNEEVYERTAKPLVDHVFAKGKATCFAYGQTGSGKTYTMMGQENVHGLYLLAAHDIINRVGENQRCWLSFYEIYGNKLYDLLNNKNELVSREDYSNQVQIVGLLEHPVDNVAELMQTIQYGNSVRSTGSTGANQDSSRSHAILQIEIKQKRKSGKYGSYGKFTFIDLAGSERGADTYNNDKKTRREGANINQSLLALKECIRGLDQNHKHIPFRGSKLTEVLRDSFVGNSRTVMIANVGPSTSSCEHSLNTLRYADRVKEITRDKSRKKQRRKSVKGKAIRKRDSSSSSRNSSPSPIPAPSKVSVPKQQAAPSKPQMSRPSAVVSKNADNKSQITKNALNEMGTAELERAHEELINTILEEEEEVIEAHRKHIDDVMEHMKSEMKLLHDVEQPGSAIELYVTNLDDILIRKIHAITALRNKLAEFQQHLREEEILSRSFMK